jgi:hypothetical protein
MCWYSWSSVDGEEVARAVQDHTASFTGECRGDPPADAVATAGDQRNSIVQPHNTHGRHVIQRRVWYRDDIF